MSRRIVGIAGVLVLVIQVSSCSLIDRDALSGVTGIFSGVLAWGRQDWPAAISSFMETTLAAEEAKDNRLLGYAEYGLASVYLSQDELTAAEDRLVRMDASGAGELAPSLWYQRGIIAFRRGSFSEAASFFKHSLELDPDSIDAKINLELSRRSESAQAASREAAASGVHEEKKSERGEDAIFNLIRKKEQDRWKNQENQQTEQDVADY